MIRPLFLTTIAAALVVTGCAGRQYAHILAHDDADMVGSHAAGSATWNPLVESAVAQLLSRCPPAVQTASATGVDPTTGVDPAATVIAADGSFEMPAAVASVHTGSVVGPATVCFIGIENKSAEELADFKDQLYETIDSQVNSSDGYRGVSRRLVDAALRESRLRPDALFLPANRQLFSSILGRDGTPVDYLLYATITSGTTDRNRSSQRDYVLTLEMVNVHSGDFIKESAKIRKGYTRTRAGKWWNWGPGKQADG